MKISLAACATVLLLAACGTEPTGETTPGPSSSTTPGSDTTPTPVDDVPTGPTIENPEDFLLTVSDLPDGYTVESSTADGTQAPGAEEDVEVVSGVEACARLFDGGNEELFDTAVIDFAGVGFSGGEFGPFLEHGINVYSPGDAALDDEFALYEGVLDDCDGESVTVADTEGSQLAMNLSRVDFAPIGDRVGALAMTGRLLEFDVEVEVLFVLVQVGDTTSSFSAMSMAGEVLPEQTFTDLVTLAVDRLEAAH